MQPETQSETRLPAFLAVSKEGIRPVGQSRFEDEDGADTRGFGGWVATGKAPCGVPPLRPPDFDSDPVATWRKRGLRRWCL